MPKLINMILGPLTAPSIKGRVWKHWYRYFERKVASQPLRFMNYGLSPTDSIRPALDSADEPERLSIQLYHRVVSRVALENADILEISCGRGGGADFTARYFRPARLTALDRTESALAACRKRFTHPALRFTCGDAMSLPFADAAFDAVINVEASHCYPGVPGFFAEVRRVLKPAGHFLYADFRRQKALPEWRAQLAAGGLTLVDEEDMTQGVVAALSSSHAMKASLIQQVAPRFLRSTFNQFAGTQGSVIYRAFETGNARYLRFVLRKP